jgi:HPt (histidine-containing phosphotransfer) domain-containing protein
LVQLFFSQTEYQLKQLGEALRNLSLPDVQHLAHSSAGASATCGIRPLARLLREIEFAAAKGDITGIPELLNASTNEFIRVRAFVHTQMGLDSTPRILKH